MEMWQIFDDAFAVELASGSLYANKVATAAMSSIANRAHEKRRAHDLGCKRLCSMGLLLCCCRPQEFVLVSSHNTTSPRVCLNVRDLVNCQPFVMSRSVHCSLYMLRMRKRATHGHTMRKRSSSKPHQLLFGNFYRSLRSHSLALAEKKHATGRFENGLILQRKGKGCFVGKQSTQLLYYFVPFEKGLKCGKQKGTI